MSHVRHRRTSEAARATLAASGHDRVRAALDRRHPGRARRFVFDVQVALASAQANLQQKLDDYNVKQAEAQRREKLGTLTTSVEEKQTYIGNADVARGAYAAALSQLSQARVNSDSDAAWEPSASIRPLTPDLVMQVVPRAGGAGADVKAGRPMS